MHHIRTQPITTRRIMFSSKRRSQTPNENQRKPTKMTMHHICPVPPFKFKANQTTDQAVISLILDRCLDI